MDALEPGISVHHTWLAVPVISAGIVACASFYLRFGPEPIIPDPELQQLCYNYGFSNSLRRSLISYGVYACVVFMVMAISDPTYGMLHVVADELHPLASANLWDRKAWVVLGIMAAAVTLLCVFVSAIITHTMAVDVWSSMKMSRSVHEAFLMDACTRYRRKSFREMTEAFQEVQESIELPQLPSSGVSDQHVSALGPANAVAGAGLFGSYGCSAMINAPACPKDALHLKHIEEQARLPVAVCFSVLVYDVLGLVVCAVWGAFVVRSYVIIFGTLAGKHSVVYLLSVLVYVIFVTAALSRCCLVFFPSAEELRLSQNCGPEEGQRPLIEVEAEGDATC